MKFKIKPLVLIISFFGLSPAFAQVRDTGDKVGIGTTSPQEKLHVEGTTTIVGNIDVPTTSHWNTGSHTLELANTDEGDVVLSFHRAGHSSASIRHSSKRGFIFSGDGAVNSNHLFISSNGNIGIGTASPVANLHVGGDGVRAERFTVSGINDRTNNSPWYGLGRSSFLDLSSTDDKGAVQVAGYYGLLFKTNNGTMGIHQNGNVLIGKTAQINSSYKLDIAGKVRANEIVVNTTGADYVFESGYQLPELNFVEQFISENNHLPGIPSAAEMQKEGMSVGELNTKLLEKIEELTLYVIELKKENESQNEMIQKLLEESDEK